MNFRDPSILTEPSIPPLKPQPIGLDVLRERYLCAGERTTDDVFVRVARALAAAEKPNDRKHHEALFLQNMRRGAIGAGRIMSAAGTHTTATLINCFVQPVGDCIHGIDGNGCPGIHEALREAAQTMRCGGGVGYDFSRIRPKDAEEYRGGSMAWGPCDVIQAFDTSCRRINTTGARRCAQMGVLRIDHPDVLEFITAKRTPGRWTNFNVSVAVTDRFIQAVRRNEMWPLVHTAKPARARVPAGARPREFEGKWVYRTVAARELWETIMRSAYDFSEPGILFLDQLRTDNNLRYCETIDATNPCGEAPLPSYGCCDLGPIILPRFVQHPFGVHGVPSFDFEEFSRSVKVQVRMLDNVLDVTAWPLPQHRTQAVAKRRIGVGFTGLGNTLTMLGLRYDRDDGRAMATQIAACMRNAAYAASVELAREKGAFPMFKADGVLAEGTFASRLPESLKAAIRQHGIRNSHLLSIAPTGTVSLAFADNASNGIEPAFSWTARRKKREADGSTREYTVEDHAWRVYQRLGGRGDGLPQGFVSALEISVEDHLAMMRCVQPYVDAAISKTVNVPANLPYEAFKGLYLQAWTFSLKGLATYRPNRVRDAVLTITPAGPK